MATPPSGESFNAATTEHTIAQLAHGAGPAAEYATFTVPVEVSISEGSPADTHKGWWPMLAQKVGQLLGGRTIEEDIFDPHRQTRRERQLLSQFPKMLGQVSFTDILHMGKDENGNPRKIPRTIDNYRLVPLLPPRHLKGEKTSLASGFNSQLPKGVHVEYPGHQYGTPFMDTSLGIGLVYDDRLVAVSGACLNELDAQYSPGQPPQETMFVQQLQAVHARPHTPKDRYRTGLHAGILWRDTLVEAWGNIATQLDMQHFVVQAAARIHWNSKVGEEGARFEAGYDAVAQRMGFMQLPNGNWYKSLK